MGLYETILEIRKQEGLEQGLEKGLVQGLEQGILFEQKLSNLEKIIEPIDKCIKGGMIKEQIATIFNIHINFITEYVTQKVNTQNLNSQLKRLRKQFKASYTIEHLETDLVKILSLHKFSAKTISKVLGLKITFVKQIQKDNKK